MKGFRDFLRENPIEPLLEMATVCAKSDGYGIILRVYNRDEHNPPHMHLFDLSGKELGKVILTDKAPKTIDDLRFDKDTKRLPSKVKNAIVKWGNTVDEDLGIINWRYARRLWKTYSKDWE